MGQENEPAVTTPTFAYYLPVVQKASLFSRTENSPFYLQNYANHAGCNWLGIAGEVFDLTGEPVLVDSYQVHIWGSGIDNHVAVGSAPEYGPAAWELVLNDSPLVRDYSIRLETIHGTAVSPTYHLQTRAKCAENLIIFNFVQVTPT
ncbi:MAG: hypothetical protein ACE5E7_00985 [Anaerolineae bacterium]